MSGRFGYDPTCKWQPWSFEGRIKVAKSVEKFKMSLEAKKVAKKTKRSKVTEFIVSKKSRQEFPPLIGEFINNAHVEPLHLKSNAWQYFFKTILKEALGKSGLLRSVSTFADVPSNSCFYKVIHSLQYEVKAKRLAKKVKKWFDET